MVKRNNTFMLIRTVVYTTTILFGIILIALGGVVSRSDISIAIGSSISSLCIATGITTILSLGYLGVMVDYSTPVVYTYMEKYEVSATCIIGILWFSTAGASIAGSGFVGSCSRYDTSGSHVVLGCHVSSATAIFGLINGTLLIFYSLILCCICRCFDCWENIGQNVTNTELTSVPRLPVENATNTVPSAIGNNSFSTLKDDTDATL